MHTSAVRGLAAAVATGLVLSIPAHVGATTRNVTPSTIGAALASARGGEVLVLAPGVYSQLTLKGRRFATPIVIDARAATIVGASLLRSSGVTLRGGAFRVPAANREGGARFALRLQECEAIKISDASFNGPGATHDKAGAPYGDGVGIKINESADVEVTRNRFQGFKNGVNVTLSKRFVVKNNTFSWMRSDGIQVNRSREGVIEANTCRFTRVRDGEHPDCIQLWSRPTAPPTSDIVIRGNDAEGATQGIGAFNHIREGVDDGGFDRITIENNRIAVSRPNAITLLDARGSVVRNNRVSTLPGSRHRAKIRVTGDVSRCGNVVEANAGDAAQTDEKC